MGSLIIRHRIINNNQHEALPGFGYCNLRCGTRLPNASRLRTRWANVRTTSTASTTTRRRPTTNDVPTNGTLRTNVRGHGHEWSQVYAPLSHSLRTRNGQVSHGLR